ncbi:MAG TPA: hypothetical protein VK605_04040 [Solirubrobacteraceae bacterium]|nr:hypothetical protein [Solirubrobacteraceae bacterium]
MMTSLIWILICPLGMLAMGGIAWGLGRLPGRRAERLARRASRASCMPMGGAKQQPGEAEEIAPVASTEKKIPAHV